MVNYAKINNHAGMTERSIVADCKSAGLVPTGVQIPLPAPKKYPNLWFGFFLFEIMTMNESGRPTENSSNFYFEPPDLTSLYNVGQSAENGADVKYSLEIAGLGPTVTQERTIDGDLILKPAENPEAKIAAYNNSDLPEIVGNLKEELASCNPLEHPNFVDHGIMAAVYSVHDSDGEHLVARLRNTVDPHPWANLI